MVRGHAGLCVCCRVYICLVGSGIMQGLKFRWRLEESSGPLGSAGSGGPAWSRSSK